MEHFSLLRLADLHHSIFDHFLFLLAAEEMCQSGRHEMFRRLVLVVENQVLQDDHEVRWIAIQCNKIGLCNVGTPLRLNDGLSGGTCLYTHFSNPYIGVDLSMAL